MSDSVYSSSWYRVAQLRPRLRSHIQIHRHRYRGQTWYVLQDHVSGRFHRFSPLANFIFGMLNGQRTVEEIWTLTYERHGDNAPTQDEIISLLTQLHAADVLLSGAPPDLVELKGRTENRVRQERLSRWRSPLSIKIPLFDPERWLSKWQRLAEFAFGRVAAAIWLVVVGYATVQVAIHWSPLTDNVTDKVLSLENLVLIALIFPFAKAFHELGHALAIKKWGGEVHEIGVMFLVFVPVPYVDASQSSAFRYKRQRALVGAAGMLFELFLAALAMLVWLNAEPGTVRTIAYNTMLIAGVSTLFFNGNPLLRFDGYYIFMDWLELPNLASRSNQYFGYLVQRYLLRLPNVESKLVSPAESRWFLFYAVGSFLYRMFIMIVILTMVASQYFVIGVVMAVWAGYSALIAPLYKKLKFLVSDQSFNGNRGAALSAVSLLICVVGAILFLLPVPYRTMAQGVVWSPEESWVRAGSSGFVTAVDAVPGMAVKKGQALLICDDPVLSARTLMLAAEVREVETRHKAAAAVDPVAAATIREELQYAEERFEEARRQEHELVISSPVDGIFVLREAAQDMPGRFISRGEPVAYVVDDAVTTVRVVVQQADVDLIRHRLRSVSVRVSDQAQSNYKAIVKREVPAATDELPSMALSTAGGGRIAINPETDGQRTIQSMFQFDLEIVDDVFGNRIGQRVYVRFDHGWEPLAYRWYRSARRLFLRKFNV